METIGWHYLRHFIDLELFKGGENEGEGGHEDNAEADEGKHLKWTLESDWHQGSSMVTGVFLFELSADFRVSLPGNQAISGNCYPEVEFREKNLNFLNF